jgi:hypothetical protein
MRLDQEARIVGALGQGKEARAEPVGQVDLAAAPAEQEEAPENREELRGVADPSRRPASSRSPLVASAKSSSTAVVFPIPGSPVTKTICRSPFVARSKHKRSSLSSRSRPTTGADGVGFAGDGETLEGLWGAEGSTRATNR